MPRPRRRAGLFTRLGLAGVLSVAVIAAIGYSAAVAQASTQRISDGRNLGGAQISPRGGVADTPRQGATARPARSSARVKAQKSRIYWGAWIDGASYGFGNAPWDMRSVAAFERETGKGVSIIHFGQPWFINGVAQRFYPGVLDPIRAHGSLPLVDWGSWNLGGSATDQPAFSLARIIDGTYDSYITAWATGARDWGHPFFLRFDHEMNGDWYAWSELRNGNKAGQFAAAWRHVHDLFVAAGATNVTWVWSPVIEYPGWTPLAELYPGNAYVDWVAMDGYNSGLNPIQPDRWRSFSELFGPTYATLGRIAPGKPIMIAETSSTEIGGSKAAWITDALGKQLPTAFPRVKAVVWFNRAADGMDWLVASSATARKAFAAAIGSAYYTRDEFGGASVSPIPAP
jgi:hypothetical protein